MTHLLNAAEILSILQWTIVSSNSESKAANVANIRITPSLIMGFAVMILGTWVRLEAFRCLGRDFVYNTAIRKGHKLTTHGIYSTVRHPGYTGALLYSAGALVCQLCPGSYCAEVMGRESEVLRYICCTIYAGLLAIFFVGFTDKLGREDRLLRNEFQEEWDRWARKTPYRLIPYVY